MKVVLDIDGVFARFVEKYAALLAQANGADLFPLNWKDDPDFPPIWNFEVFYGYSPEVVRKVWNDHILSSRNFWLKLKPMPHARESLMMLDRLARAGEIEVFFLTHRMGLKARWQTEQWIYANGFSFPAVIMTENKAPILRALGANFFIDDKVETLVEVARISRAEKWPNFQLYTQDQPYNRSIQTDTGKRVSSIKEALQDAGLWRELR